MQAGKRRPITAALGIVWACLLAACSGTEGGFGIKTTADLPFTSPDRAFDVTAPGGRGGESRVVRAVLRAAPDGAEGWVNPDDLAAAELLEARMDAVPSRTDWQCVPYARMVSGVNIRGDAWTWWASAADRFARGHLPDVGAVLVLRRSGSMRLGHVAVVREIVGPREIIVAHANWGNTRATRGRVTESSRVVDVSENNDWSQLRFEWPPTGVLGRTYPAYGFIYPGAMPPPAAPQPVIMVAALSMRAAAEAEPAYDGMYGPR